MHNVIARTEKLPALNTAEWTAQKVGVSADRLRELAEAGYVPHWRIDGGEPMFHLAETKQWVLENLVSRHAGEALPPSLLVVTEVEPAEFKLRPSALQYVAGLRDISFFLTYRSGIYFLVAGDEVVYVGQSVQVGGRLIEHIKTKSFERVFFLPWPASELDQLEGAFIRLLRPPLNGANGAHGNPTADAALLASLGVGDASEMDHRVKPGDDGGEP